jgi:hypothetical protein
VLIGEADLSDRESGEQAMKRYTNVLHRGLDDLLTDDENG